MIQGNNVTIRNVRERDLETLYALTVDLRDAGEYMPVSLVSESAFWEEFSRTGFWANDSGKLVIETSSDGIVGEIGCFEVAHYLDGRELYYRVFSGARGRGYASEAVRLFVGFFFESTPMNRIQALTVDGNKVSEHILEKIGFEREGRLRQARWFKGRLVDLNLFSFLRSDAPNLRQAKI